MDSRLSAGLLAMALLFGDVAAAPGSAVQAAPVSPEPTPVQESIVVQDVLQPKQVMKSAPTPKPAPVEEIVSESPQNCDLSVNELVTAIRHLDSSVSVAKAKKYINTVLPLAHYYRIDPLWIFAMMFQESSFDEDVVSSHGAVGLMQLMPATAKSNFGVSRASLFNPETNIKLGITYLAKLRKGYKGDLRKATIAYNQGVTRVNKGKYSTKYYTKVKKHYDKIAPLVNNKNCL